MSLFHDMKDELYCMSYMAGLSATGNVNALQMHTVLVFWGHIQDPGFVAASRNVLFN